MNAFATDILGKYGIAVAATDEVAASEPRASEFKKRSGLFTASELHKLLTAKGEPAKGATAEQYICEKAYERLTGYAVSKGSGYQQTEWGNEYEDAAIMAFERVTGLKVSLTGRHQKFHKADDYPFGATLDGIVGDTHIVEVKCPFNGGVHIQNLRFANDLDWFKSSRFDYYVQIQGGLWASGRQEAWFVSYDPGCSRERDTFERTMFETFPEKMRCAYALIPRDEIFIAGLKRAVSAAEESLQKILSKAI